MAVRRFILRAALISVVLFVVSLVSTQVLDWAMWRSEFDANPSGFHAIVWVMMAAMLVSMAVSFPALPVAILWPTLGDLQASAMGSVFWGVVLAALSSRPRLAMWGAGPQVTQPSLSMTARRFARRTVGISVVLYVVFAAAYVVLLLDVSSPLFAMSVRASLLYLIVLGSPWLVEAGGPKEACLALVVGVGSRAILLAAAWAAVDRVRERRELREGAQARRDNSTDTDATG